MLEQLRYVRLPVDDLAGASRYAMDVLGLEPIDRTETLATFRSDFRDHTLVFVKDARAEQAIGLELRFPTDLDAARFSLRKLGIVAESGTPEECAQRKCRAMLWFRDFSGNRIELVVRPLNSGWRYFPSRDAGVTGLQDVILRSTDVERDLSIWRGVFEATVSDYAGDAAYLAFDGAHHRIALYPVEARRHPCGRIRRRECEPADAQPLRCAEYAGRHPARAGTPSCVRPVVPDPRGTDRRPVRLRGRRHCGGFRAAAAAIPGWSRWVVFLGQRVPHSRIRRVRGWPQPAPRRIRLRRPR